MNIAVGMEDPLALQGRAGLVLLKKLKLSAGILLNKQGEGANFILSSYFHRSLSFFSIFVVGKDR